MAEEERRRIPPDPPPSASTPTSRPRPGERVTIDHDPEIHKKREVVKKERPEKVEYVKRPAGLPAAIKRISWGAILAGATLTLVTLLALSLLGLAIGLGTVDPATEANPFSGLATGSAIWLAVSTFLSLLLGGFTAARLAGLPKRTDGILHGLVTWGLVTLLTLFLATTVIGRLLSGALGVVGQGIEAVGQGVAAVAPETAETVQQQLQQVQVPQTQAVDDALDEIKSEAVQLVTIPTGPSQPSPSAAETTAQQDTLQVFGAVQPPQDTLETFGPAQVTGEAEASRAEAEREVRSALDRLRTEDGQPVSQEIKTAIVSVLADRTRLSEAEARQQVNAYEQRLQQAGQEVEQTAQQVQREATQVGDEVAADLSRAALWGFLGMLLGALASALGGALGAPKDLLVTPAVSRDELVAEPERT